MIVPRFTLIAGPDGSGKSTLARQAGFQGTLGNADDIAREINPQALKRPRWRASSPKRSACCDLIVPRSRVIARKKTSTLGHD